MNLTKGEIAYRNFLSGMNCSESVVMAFKDEIPVDEDVLKSMVTGLGAGLGRQRLVCGAVSGMTIVISVLNPTLSKAEIYALVQKACADFKAGTGSLICGELLSGITADSTPMPSERSGEYYRKRPCPELCRLAADIAAKYVG